jgi:tRNA threonylcarbamoyl adenosine modification protein YeaZ
MILLAIELSSRDGSIALRDAAGSLHRRSVPPGGRSSEPLLPEIDALFAAAATDRRHLEAIAVSVGPGGFTGLRVATAAAKGIAEALGCRTVAVPSAVVAAESWRREAAADPPPPLLVALQSKGRSAWLEALAFEQDRWRRLATPGIATPEALLDAHRPSGGSATHLLGDRFVPEALIDALRKRDPQLVGPIEPRFDAIACLRLAERAFATPCEADPVHEVDPLELAPCYPREPEAVSIWNLRHGDDG